MNRAKILELLRRAGHEEHAAAVEKLLRPAVFIDVEALARAPHRGGDADDEEDDEEEDDDEDEPKLPTLDVALAALPLGASRFGGIPDLPPGVAWPARDDVPMELVAQIRLADVAPFDAARQLPASGSLLFFYNSQWDTSDMNAEAACCAVIYHDGGDDALVRTPPPRVDFEGEYDSEPRLAPYVHGLGKLRFSAFEMVPGGVSPWISEAPLVDFWQDFHSEHSQEMSPSEEPYHENHLLGYVDEQDYVDAHANGRDDQLLLQVDSEDRADMNWGDANKLFFILRRDELARRDFSKVRLYMGLG